MKRTHFALIMIGVFLIAGCNAFVSSAIQDTTCQPPCWNGIIPGQTNRQEALAALSSLPEVNQSTTYTMTTVVRNDTIRFDFKLHTGDLNADIFLDEDVVQALSIFPIRLPLEVAIQQLGEPESVIAINDHAERPSIIILLCYPSQGIVLSSLVYPYHKGDSVQLESDTPIGHFWYFEADKFTELMTSNYMVNIDPSIIDQDMHLWTGYGDITPIIVDWR